MALFFLFLTLSVSPFKSKSRLEAENAALRHQLIVLQRKLRGRVRLTNGPASSYAFSTAAALHAKATLATSPLDRMRAYLIGGLHRLEFQESCPVFRFQSNFPVKADAHTMPLGRNSSSASRLTAGALGFFILSQSRERPLR